MEQLLQQYQSVTQNKVMHWFKAGNINDFPKDGGACVKYKSKQIAVYHFARKSAWYACQNLCPHKMEMVLSRGMVGDLSGIPKVACPLHKKTFSLENGENLNGEDYKIATYPVKIENENVYIGFTD
ncbi:nitrite reductase small subunit NirD [Joostella atrarenae]|uniref:Nitrite reductase small subunit NirD n=1 Tax=Joostella atrarenae TaxID=679257 RepID=A0ABS9J4P1_9FLAO|nr:nitrite reductase small subunit NirD [Joostella atrarenae]MCF8715303.1 nitrite reductase small subunit NirD [Joostella atrarenae]